MFNLGRFIGKFPFAGKLTIRPRVINFRTSKNWAERRANFSILMRFMVVYILIHITQSVVGFWATTFVAPLWAIIYFYAYAIANAIVMLTQIEISVRSTIFLYRGRYPEGEKIYPDYSRRNWLATRAITLLGQIAFAALFLLYFP